MASEFITYENHNYLLQNPSSVTYNRTQVIVGRISPSPRPVILNGCAARFARRAAKLSRGCDIEKIIKIVPFNINFEKGTRGKCSRALINLFSRRFIGLQSKSSVISEKLELVVSYTKVHFMVELSKNTRISCSNDSSL
jgi:hypothetical protein